MTPNLYVILESVPMCSPHFVHVCIQHTIILKATQIQVACCGPLQKNTLLKSGFLMLILLCSGICGLVKLDWVIKYVLSIHHYYLFLSYSALI